MLAKDCVTKNGTSRTPRKTVWSAAELLKTHDIGALVVVSSISDPLLEGTITDRDLCCSVVAATARRTFRSRPLPWLIWGQV